MEVETSTSVCLLPVPVKTPGEGQSKPININVTFRNDDLVNRLRAKIAEMHRDIESLKRRYKDLEISYCNEVYVNNELCDICRANGVKFRRTLSHQEREKYGR